MRQKWHAEANELEAQRNALANEMRDTYSDVASKIPDLFARIRQNDQRLSNLRGKRPSGVSRHLLSAELVARGLDRFDRDEPSIVERLELPAFSGQSLLWPPRQIPSAVIVAESLAAATRAPQQAQQAERDRDEQQRITDYYAERTRKQEQRQNNEERAEFARRRQGVN